jgi:hypothetical protein
MRFLPGAPQNPSVATQSKCSASKTWSRNGRELGLILLLIAGMLIISRNDVLASGTILFGDQAIESQLDNNVSGQAEAFQTTATASGVLGSLNVYIDSHSTAAQIFLGLYGDNSGHPGALLTQGSTTQITKAAWNTISVPNITTTSGAKYWIAILGTGSGTPFFRDRNGGPCNSETSKQTTLTSLPSSWSSGTRYTDCPLSSFGTAAAATQPILSLSATALSFGATQGGGNPASSSVNITNSGSGTLSYTLSSDQTWLTATPVSGSVPQSLTVTAATGTLTAGTYTGHLTITAAGAQGSPGTVTVTFVVAPPPPPQPVLTVLPTTLTFGATQGGGNPASSSVNITNSGSGTLSYTLSSDQTWLTATPVSGSAPQSLTVTAATGTLTAGTYTGHLTIAAAGAQGSPGTVTVTFVVAPPPVLTVSPATLTFAATQGGGNPATQTASVTNSGGGTLSYTLSSDQTWLTAAPASGNAPQTLTVTAATGTLTASTYSGHLTITATGVQGSPATVTVTFNVSSAPPPTVVLLGDQTLESSGDSNPLGQAEAFQTTATATGNLSSLSVYLDSSNSVAQLTIGLYADSGGHPGTLLTQGSTTKMTNAAWNKVSVPAVNVTSGAKYWIAILGTQSGTLAYRDSPTSRCGDEGSAQTNLTSLPLTWSTGPTYSNCPLSGYGSTQ